MDDGRLGLAFRRVRLRLGWRQRDVADRAGISQPTYSRIERGHLDVVSLRLLRRVATVLEVRLDMTARWRGAELDRMLAAGHALMHERVAELLTAAGWECRPEVSFSHFGERGVVDIVALDRDRGVFLIVELKTEIVDVNDLLATMDRRRRLARVIAESVGWDAASTMSISSWVVVADTRSNRRRLARHRTLLRSAFPDDGRAVRGWIRRPSRPMACLWFLPDRHGRTARRDSTGRQRVRRGRPCTPITPDPAIHPRHD